MGRNDKSLGVNYQNVIIRWHLLKYKEMYVVTPIHIRYVVISIVLVTSMLSIELFILHNFVHLLGFSSITYISLSLIGLRYILV